MLQMKIQCNKLIPWYIPVSCLKFLWSCKNTTSQKKKIIKNLKLQNELCYCVTMEICYEKTITVFLS